MIDETFDPAISDVLESIETSAEQHEFNTFCLAKVMIECLAAILTIGESASSEELEQSVRDGHDLSIETLEKLSRFKFSIHRKTLSRPGPAVSPVFFERHQSLD